MFFISMTCRPRGLAPALLAWLLLSAPCSVGAPEDTAGTERCRACHDYAPAEHVERLLLGSHGISTEAGFERGCEDCHGASAAHAAAPRENSPQTSFGPRWSASSAAQDGACLSCHESDTAGNWQHALHMLNNLTCVTCHDIHSEQDRVLLDEQQAQVCTMCHKVQETGMHGRSENLAKDPPCSSCHNPHNHESAQPQMLTNQSQGCRHCHDLAAMADDPLVAAKANSYHRVMQEPGNTCLDCHQGIAHATAASAPPMQPLPVQQGTVTLFYPGMADSDWLLKTHPGAQPLQQGTDCRRCHRGDEAEMGTSLSDSQQAAYREIELAFARENNELLITLQWQGPADDQTLALMWGGSGSDAFQRGACFAACHNDMPGMSQDSGRQEQKYLQISRDGKAIKDDVTLQQLLQAGVFAEMWRISLHSTTLERTLLQAGSDPLPEKLISINKQHDRGLWSVALRYRLDDTKVGIDFTNRAKYTFGIALNGAANPGHRHWVSLPLTLSFGGQETDFTAQ